MRLKAEGIRERAGQEVRQKEVEEQLEKETDRSRQLVLEQ